MIVLQETEQKGGWCLVALVVVWPNDAQKESFLYLCSIAILFLFLLLLFLRSQTILASFT